MDIAWLSWLVNTTKPNFHVHHSPLYDGPPGSDVPGLAWAQSPGLGWASAGSGFSKPKPDPEPIVGPGLGLVGLKPRLESRKGNTGSMAGKTNVSRISMCMGTLPVWGNPVCRWCKVILCSECWQIDSTHTPNRGSSEYTVYDLANLLNKQAKRQLQKVSTYPYKCTFSFEHRDSLKVANINEIAMKVGIKSYL